MGWWNESLYSNMTDRNGQYLLHIVSLQGLFWCGIKEELLVVCTRILEYYSALDGNIRKALAANNKNTILLFMIASIDLNCIWIWCISYTCYYNCSQAWCLYTVWISILETTTTIVEGRTGELANRSSWKLMAIISLCYPNQTRYLY